MRGSRQSNGSGVISAYIYFFFHFVNTNQLAISITRLHFFLFFRFSVYASATHPMRVIESDKNHSPSIFLVKWLIRIRSTNHNLSCSAREKRKRVPLRPRFCRWKQKRCSHSLSNATAFHFHHFKRPIVFVLLSFSPQPFVSRIGCVLILDYYYVEAYASPMTHT